MKSSAAPPAPKTDIRLISRLFDEYPTVSSIYPSLKQGYGRAFIDIQKKLDSAAHPKASLVMHASSVFGSAAPAILLTFPNALPHTELKGFFLSAAFKVANGDQPGSFIVYSDGLRDSSDPNHRRGYHPGYTAAVTLAKIPSLLSHLEITPAFVSEFEQYKKRWEEKNNPVPAMEAKEYQHLHVDGLAGIIRDLYQPPLTAKPVTPPTPPEVDKPIDKSLLQLRTLLNLQWNRLNTALIQKKIRQNATPWHPEEKQLFDAQSQFNTQFKNFYETLFKYTPKPISVRMANEYTRSLLRLATLVTETPEKKELIHEALQAFKQLTAPLAHAYQQWALIIGAIIGAVIGLALGCISFGFALPLSIMIGTAAGSAVVSGLIGAQLGFFQGKSREPVHHLVDSLTPLVPK